MSGMGTLHLEVKRHRLERDFRLKVRVGKPRVSYREMLRSGKTVEVTVDRLGDKPAYAHLRVSFTNLKSERPVAVANLRFARSPAPALCGRRGTWTDRCTPDRGIRLPACERAGPHRRGQDRAPTFHRKRVRGRGHARLPRCRGGEHSTPRTDHEAGRHLPGRVHREHHFRSWESAG